MSDEFDKATFVFRNLRHRLIAEQEVQSPHWLSPGIDVPHSKERPSGSRAVGGFVANLDCEAAFIPTEQFMQNPAQERMDILADILVDVQRVYLHALVSYFREFQEAMGPDQPLETQLQAFKERCTFMQYFVPEELFQILARDVEFRRTTN